MNLSEAWEIAFNERDMYLKYCKKANRKVDWNYLKREVYRTVRELYQFSAVYRKPLLKSLTKG